MLAESHIVSESGNKQQKILYRYTHAPSVQSSVHPVQLMKHEPAVTTR